MQSLFLWIVLHILTSIFTGMVSSIKPLTLIEMRIPFLPPTIPIDLWLDRALVSPWMRWDAVWYQRIVTQGYSASDGTAQFHPLYPWLATPLARIGISPGLSLLIISSLAGLGLFYLFNKLAQIDLSHKDSSFAVILFVLAPPAFILFAPYAESLFLALAVLCIIFLRQKKWWLAGLMGGLATLTRQQGLLLLIPMAWELWEHMDHKLPNILKHWRDWFALVLIPVGMVSWLSYRALLLNDLHLLTSNIQEFLYSFLISPSAVEVVPNQQFVWPWLALNNAFVKVLSRPDIDIWVNIISGMLFLILLAISWRKIRLSYRLYSLSIAWVSFSYYTGPLHPYMGLPRHLLLAFPIFIGLAALIQKPWMRLFLSSLSGIAMAFLLVLYVLSTWVS